MADLGKGRRRSAVGGRTWLAVHCSSRPEGVTVSMARAGQAVVGGVDLLTCRGLVDTEDRERDDGPYASRTLVAATCSREVSTGGRSTLTVVCRTGTILEH